MGSERGRTFLTLNEPATQCKSGEFLECVAHPTWFPLHKVRFNFFLIRNEGFKQLSFFCGAQTRDYTLFRHVNKRTEKYRY